MRECMAQFFSHRNLTVAERIPSSALAHTSRLDGCSGRGGVRVSCRDGDAQPVALTAAYICLSQVMLIVSIQLTAHHVGRFCFPPAVSTLVSGAAASP